MLAVVVSVARSDGSLTALYTFLCLVGYVTIMFVFIRPLLILFARYC